MYPISCPFALRYFQGIAFFLPLRNITTCSLCCKISSACLIYSPAVKYRLTLRVLIIVKGGGGGGRESVCA